MLCDSGIQEVFIPESDSALLSTLLVIHPNVDSALLAYQEYQSPNIQDLKRKIEDTTLVAGFTARKQRDIVGFLLQIFNQKYTSLYNSLKKDLKVSNPEIPAVLLFQQVYSELLSYKINLKNRTLLSKDEITALQQEYITIKNKLETAKDNEQYFLQERLDEIKTIIQKNVTQRLSQEEIDRLNYIDSELQKVIDNWGVIETKTVKLKNDSGEEVEEVIGETTETVTDDNGDEIEVEITEMEMRTDKGLTFSLLLYKNLETIGFMSKNISVETDSETGSYESLKFNDDAKLLEDPRKTVSSKFKLKLLTIPYADNRRTYIGTRELVPFDIIYNTLAREMADVPIENMMDALSKLKIRFPYMKNLEDLLLNDPVLRNMFHESFYRTMLNFEFLRVSASGSGVSFRLSNSNQNNVYNRLFNDWEERFKSRAYETEDSLGNNRFRNIKLYKVVNGEYQLREGAFKELKNNVIKELRNTTDHSERVKIFVETMEVLGIIINEGTIQALINKEDKQRFLRIPIEKFLDPNNKRSFINKIFEGILSPKTDFEGDLEDLYLSPFYSVSAKKIIRDIAKYTAQYETDILPLTITTIKGQKFFLLQRHTAITRDVSLLKYDPINRAKYLIENPFARESRILSMILSHQYGQKSEEETLREADNFELLYFEGAKSDKGSKSISEFLMLSEDDNVSMGIGRFAAGMMTDSLENQRASVIGMTMSDKSLPVHYKYRSIQSVEARTSRKDLRMVYQNDDGTYSENVFTYPSVVSPLLPFTINQENLTVDPTHYSIEYMMLGVSGDINRIISLRKKLIEDEQGYLLQFDHIRNLLKGGNAIFTYGLDRIEDSKGNVITINDIPSVKEFLENDKMTEPSELMLSDIRRFLAALVNDRVAKDYNRFLYDKAYTKKVEGRIKELYPDLEITPNLLKQYMYMEYYIHTNWLRYETMALFGGDYTNSIKVKKDRISTIYETMKEYEKRLAKEIAPRQPSYGDELTNVPERSITIRDVSIESQNTEEYQDRGLGDYKVREATDAQEYITVKNHVYRLYNQGKISIQDRDNILSKIAEGNAENGYYYELTPRQLYVLGIDEKFAQPFKPVRSGWIDGFYDEEGNERKTIDVFGFRPTIYVKSSTMVLLPSLRGSQLDRIRQLMERNNIDHAAYSTAKKVGKHKELDIFDEGGIISKTDEELDILVNNNAIVNISRSDGGEQTAVPYHAVGVGLAKGTQFSKLITVDSLDRLFDYNGERISGNALRTKINNLESEMIYLLKQELIKKIGAEQEIIVSSTSNNLSEEEIEEIKTKYKELSKGDFDKYISEKEGVVVSERFIMKDLTKLRDLIRSNARALGWDASQLASIEITEDKDRFIIPLGLHPNADKLNQIIMSMINNTMSRIKMYGKSYVQASSAGFIFNKGESSDLIFTERFNPELGLKSISTKFVKRNDDGEIVEELSWKEFKDKFGKKVIEEYLEDEKSNTFSGKTKNGYEVIIEPAQIILPSYFVNNLGQTINIRDFAKKVRYTKDGVVIPDDSEFQEGEYYRWIIDDSKINREVLNGVGFRIPTQSQSSMMPFEIVGFLPQEYGSTVLVNPEIVTQMGSDFDVDKLFNYLYQYIVEEKEEGDYIDRRTLEDQDKIKEIRDNITKKINLLKGLNKSIEKLLTPRVLLETYINLNKHSLITDQLLTQAQYKRELINGRYVYTDISELKLLERIISPTDSITTSNKKLIYYVTNNNEKINKLKNNLKSIIPYDRLEQIKDEITDIYYQMLSSRGMVDNIMEQLDLKDLAEIAENNTDVTSVRSFYDPLQASINLKNQQGGKQMVGIFALPTVLNAILQGRNVSVRQKNQIPFLYRDGNEVKEIILDRVSGTQLAKYTTNSGQVELRRKSQQLNDLLSAAVDNAKALKLTPNNILLTTVDAVIGSVFLESSLDTSDGAKMDTSYLVELLMQPIILKMVEKSVKYRSVFTNVYLRDNSVIFDELARLYFTESELKEFNKTPLSAYTLEDLKSIREKTKDMFNEDGTISGDISPELIKAQFMIFRYYLELEKIGNGLGKLRNKVRFNYPEGVGRSYWDALIKYNQATHEVTGDFPFNVDFDQFNDSDQVAIQEILSVPTQLDNALDEFIHKITLDFISQKGLGRIVDMTGDNLYNIERHIRSFIVQHPYVYGGNSYLDRYRLLVSTPTTKSLGAKILLAQKDQRLKNNYAIQSLQVYVDSIQDGIQTVAYKGNTDSNDAYEARRFTTDLLELLTSNIPEYKEIGEDIVKYAILVQGLSNNRGSFSRFIPTEYLEEIGYMDRLRNFSKKSTISNNELLLDTPQNRFVTIDEMSKNIDKWKVFENNLNNNGFSVLNINRVVGGGLYLHTDTLGNQRELYVISLPVIQRGKNEYGNVYVLNDKVIPWEILSEFYTEKTISGLQKTMQPLRITIAIDKENPSKAIELLSYMDINLSTDITPQFNMDSFVEQYIQHNSDDLPTYPQKIFGFLEAHPNYPYYIVSQRNLEKFLKSHSGTRYFKAFIVYKTTIDDTGNVTKHTKQVVLKHLGNGRFIPLPTLGQTANNKMIGVVEYNPVIGNSIAKSVASSNNPTLYSNNQFRKIYERRLYSDQYKFETEEMSKVEDFRLKVIQEGLLKSLEVENLDVNNLPKQYPMYKLFSKIMASDMKTEDKTKLLLELISDPDTDSSDFVKLWAKKLLDEKMYLLVKGYKMKETGTMSAIRDTSFITYNINKLLDTSNYIDFIHEMFHISSMKIINDYINEEKQSPAIKKLLDMFDQYYNKAYDEFKNRIGVKNFDILMDIIDKKGGHSSELFEELSKIFNDDQDIVWKNYSILYALQNRDEFFAGAMTSPDMIEFLQNIKSENKTLWDKLSKVLKEFLALFLGDNERDTLFVDVADNIYQLMEAISLENKLTIVETQDDNISAVDIDSNTEIPLSDNEGSSSVSVLDNESNNIVPLVDSIIPINVPTTDNEVFLPPLEDSDSSFLPPFDDVEDLPSPDLNGTIGEFMQTLSVEARNKLRKMLTDNTIQTRCD